MNEKLGELMVMMAGLPCAWRDRTGRVCSDCIRCQSARLYLHFLNIIAQQSEAFMIDWKEPEHEND